MTIHDKITAITHTPTYALVCGLPSAYLGAGWYREGGNSITYRSGEHGDLVYLITYPFNAPRLEVGGVTEMTAHRLRLGYVGLAAVELLVRFNARTTECPLLESRRSPISGEREWVVVDPESTTNYTTVQRFVHNINRGNWPTAHSHLYMDPVLVSTIAKLFDDAGTAPVIVNGAVCR